MLIAVKERLRAYRCTIWHFSRRHAMTSTQVWKALRAWCFIQRASARKTLIRFSLHART